MKGASEGDGAVMRDPLWSPSFECAWGAHLAWVSLPTLCSRCSWGPAARPLTVCLSRLTSIFSAAYTPANVDMHTSCSFVYSAPSAGNTLPALSAWPSPRHMCLSRVLTSPCLGQNHPLSPRTLPVTAHSPMLEPPPDSTALVRRQAAAAAKSLQSCPTLCDPIDGSPPGSPVPAILQARILEWVAISSSNAWKWKVKGKSLGHVWLVATPWTAAHQAPPSMGFSRQEYWSGVPVPSPIPRLNAVQILPDKH